MPVITCTAHTSTLNEHTTGLKAESLSMLHSMGLEVPPWIAIPVNEFNDHIPHHILKQSPSDVYSYINTLKIDSTLISRISQWIRNNDFIDDHFAIRSSICLNSSLSHTFAGQLKTHLFVPEREISEAIRSVWASPFTSSANAYRAQWGLPLESIRIAVIIQKMVNPDISGISMGIDPQSGSRSSVAISAMYGIYQGVNNNRLDSDQFTVDFSGKRPSRISKIYDKKTKVVYNEITGSGTRSTPVSFNKRSQPTLTTDQVFALAEITRTISTRCGKPQIIDWVISSNKIYILQSRPVPALRNIPDTTDYNQTWISPDITFLSNDLNTPLAYSLIRAHTTDALFTLCKKSTKTHTTSITRGSCDVLGIINGKLYLNQEMFKKIASILPFHNRIRIKKGSSCDFFSLVYTFFSFVLNFHIWTLNKDKQSKKAASKVFIAEHRHISTYKTIDFLKHFDIIQSELSTLWQQLIKNEYYMVVINELLHSITTLSGNEISFITSHILYSLTRKLSIKQIEALCEIARSISDRPSIKELFLDHTTDDICKHLYLTSVPPDTAEVALLCIRKKILKYSDNFGCTGFGNLQYTHVNSEHIVRSIIRTLRAYIATGLTNSSGLYSRCKQPRPEPNDKYSSSLVLKTCHKLLIHKLYKLIKINHDLNIQKASYFKSLSVLFDSLGKKFYSEDIINKSDDIMFLTFSEIIDLIQGRNITENCATLISIRKNEYETNRNYHMSPVLNTFGMLYCTNIIKQINQQSSRSIPMIEGTGNGAGCVKGNIQIADNPFYIEDVTKTILVIRNSDPEWIPYVPLLKGLIIEQGTAFSELVLSCTTFNIPCLFSVVGSIQTLQNNDIVELDSISGKITIFSDHAHSK